MARNNVGLLLGAVIMISLTLFLGIDAVPVRDRLSNKLDDNESWEKAAKGKNECLTQDWIDVSLDFLNVKRGLPQCYPQDQRGEFLVFLWIMICMIILLFFIAYLRCRELLKDNYKTYQLQMNCSLPSGGQLE